MGLEEKIKRTYILSRNVLLYSIATGAGIFSQTFGLIQVVNAIGSLDNSFYSSYIQGCTDFPRLVYIPIAMTAGCLLVYAGSFPVKSGISGLIKQIKNPSKNTLN